METLGLKETVDGLAKANGVGWSGHALRRENNSVLRVALDLKVRCKRKRRRRQFRFCSLKITIKQLLRIQSHKDYKLHVVKDSVSKHLSVRYLSFLTLHLGNYSKTVKKIK